MKKIIFLVFTLAIPVSVFLFLKYFGTNTFEVPVLFEQGIPGCANDTKPHVVPNIQYLGKDNKLLQSHDLDGFVVYGVLDASDPNHYNKMITDLIRIQDAFYETGSPHFLVFIQGTVQERATMEFLLEEKGIEDGHCSMAYLEKEKLHDFMRCGIGSTNGYSDPFVTLAMSDPQHRIRGIYNSMDQEGTDQLILELQILKQKK